MGHWHVQNMDSQVNECSAGDFTHQSINEQIELATELILGQVERLCALFADRIHLNTAGISETAGSRHEDASFSSANNRYDD